MLAEKVVLLTPGSLILPDKKQFYALTADAFRKMRGPFDQRALIDALYRRIVEER